MIVQVAGCREEDEQVTPFVPDEDAQFWSVYLGEYGSFECVADFDSKSDALSYANKLAQSARADTLDNRTFSKGDYCA